MGTYDKSVYRYNDTDRGKSVNKVTAVTKQTIQTGWISEQDGWLIENLLLSRNVFTIRNLVTNICEEPDYWGMDFGTATTQPVLVTDKSFKKKTTINDGIKIQYTIKIEFAQSVNTNS